MDALREPPWWRWLIAWDVIHDDPRSLGYFDRWDMLTAEREEALNVWRYLRATIG